jgi:hypothetical protein
VKLTANTIPVSLGDAKQYLQQLFDKYSHPKPGRRIPGYTLKIINGPLNPRSRDPHSFTIQLNLIFPRSQGGETIPSKHPAKWEMEGSTLDKRVQRVNGVVCPRALGFTIPDHGAIVLLYDHQEGEYSDWESTEAQLEIAHFDWNQMNKGKLR